MVTTTKNVFYGAAIQGALKRGDRSELNRTLIGHIKASGFNVIFEQTGGADSIQTASLLERSLGALPADDYPRWRFVRNKMVEGVEAIGTKCCIFEVSTPSTGTGIEIAHAYLRPRMGLPAIPVLALYERGYWPNGLSTMIRGISPEEVSHFTLKEYADVEEAKAHIAEILRKLPD